MKGTVHDAWELVSGFTVGQTPEFGIVRVSGGGFQSQLPSEERVLRGACRCHPSRDRLSARRPGAPSN